MIEDDVRGHAGTSNSTCVCDRAGHGNEGACSSSHGEDSKRGNEEVHLNESSGHDPAVLAKEEEEEHAAGVYFFWVDNEDEEGSPVPRRGRQGEVFTAHNRVPRDGAQVVFLIKDDGRASDEEEADHTAGVYFFSLDNEPGYASGEPRRAREGEVFTAQSRAPKEGYPLAYRTTSHQKQV